MIYINTVQTKQPMQAVKVERDFEFFKDYQPQTFEYPINENKEKAIKMNQMKIVIAGQMIEGSSRTDKNVLSRSLLFLDLDDIKGEEDDFINKMADTLKDENYCLYPTLKHKKNERIRYRLVLELNRSVNKDEYKTLLFGIYHSIGVEYDFDNSNYTWSQGQGLPVLTEHSKDSPIVYQDDKKTIPVNEFLQATIASKPYQQKLQSKQKIKAENYRQKGVKFTGKFLNELVDGVAETGRNVWFTSKIGSFINLGMTPENAYNLAFVVNENFLDFPLEESELNKIFSSVLKAEMNKRGGID